MSKKRQKRTVPSKEAHSDYFERKRKKALALEAEKNEKLRFALAPASAAVLCAVAMMTVLMSTVSAMAVPPEFGAEPTKTAATVTLSSASDAVESVEEPEPEPEPEPESEPVVVTLSENNPVPVVISGADEKFTLLGENPQYLTGVSASGGVSGQPKLIYDPSGVNIYAAGTYPVTYYADDGEGNTASTVGKVTVYHVDDATVDAMADYILAGIVTDGMTEREKARAVYDWCVGNIRYSSSTAYLMGFDSDGAYRGMKYRSGNCFVYYATARRMLTRLGIENRQIRRNSETNPHYWNLVKIDGNWYHFDTCPHYKDHPLTVFLLTDAEVNAYTENEVEDYYNFDASLYPPTP